jgi:hypothetical protein
MFRGKFFPGIGIATIVKTKQLAMKKIPFYLIFLFALSTFTSCQAIGAIFKAGVWVGVIIVVAILALILWLVNRGSGK